jgi:membrane-associated protease RseP (regulator of RpoE activity)
MSKKTFFLLALGFVGTFVVGILIGALTIRTFFNPALTLKANTSFDQDKVVLERTFSTGAMIMEILEGSPAEVADLEVGDVILRVNDEEVGKDGALLDIIRSHAVGDEIELLIVHNGEKESLVLTLGEHPEDVDVPFLGVVARPFTRGPKAGGIPGGRFEYPHHGHMDEPMPFHHHGDMVEPMPFHHPEDDFDMMGGPGLVVMHVAEGSPAEEGGLLPTDIIIAIDGTEITGFDQFAGIISSYDPGDGITLSIFRDGEELELDITLGEHPEEEGRAYLGVMGFGLHEFMPDKLRPGLNFESQG